MLQKVSGGLSGIAQKVPGMNNLMSKIQLRKSRDKIVMCKYACLDLLACIEYLSAETLLPGLAIF